MKSLYAILVVSLLSPIVLSQPLETTIKTDLKKEFPNATRIGHKDCTSDLWKFHSLY